MQLFLSISLSVLLLAYTQSAQALHIFACEPEWAALSKELSGDLNSIESALNVTQDPHRLQAKPSLIASIRKVELLVCTGSDLEIGWMPLLLRRSGNRQIQIGQPGNFEASSFVRRLEIPMQLDRSQGDLHPQGNPHVHLDPRNIRIIAKALSKRLILLDPENADKYQNLLNDFLGRWKIALASWKEKAKPLAGTQIVSYRTGFSYLFKAYGLDNIATIETKPGISPSSTHLSSLLNTIKTRSPKFLVLTPYEDPKSAEWLSKRTGLPIKVLPYSVGENHSAKDLFELFDVTLSLLLEEQ